MTTEASRESIQESLSELIPTRPITIADLIAQLQGKEPESLPYSLPHIELSSIPDLPGVAEIQLPPFGDRRPRRGRHDPIVTSRLPVRRFMKPFDQLSAAIQEKARMTGEYSDPELDGLRARLVVATLAYTADGEYDAVGLFSKRRVQRPNNNFAPDGFVAPSEKVRDEEPDLNHLTKLGWNPDQIAQLQRWSHDTRRTGEPLGHSLLYAMFRVLTEEAASIQFNHGEDISDLLKDPEATLIRLYQMRQRVYNRMRERAQLLACLLDTRTAYFVVVFMGVELPKDDFDYLIELANNSGVQGWERESEGPPQILTLRDNLKELDPGTRLAAQRILTRRAA